MFRYNESFFVVIKVAYLYFWLIILFLSPLLSYYSDIDECGSGSHNCSEHATCINTDGHFNCSCKPGYIGDGYMCSGIISTFS